MTISAKYLQEDSGDRKKLKATMVDNSTSLLIGSWKSAIRMHTLKIKERLMLLLDGINESDGEAVLAHIRELDVLVGEAAGGLDARLSHFLERRSYAKALAWLEEAEGAPGKSSDTRS